MAKERMPITIHLVHGEDDDLIKKFKSVTGQARADMAKKLWRGQSVIIGGHTGDTELLQDIVNRVYWLQEEYVKYPQILKDMLSTLRATAPMAVGPAPEDTARASKEALDRRKERNKKNDW